MGMSSQRQQEGKHVDIYSKLERPHTDAEHAALMIHVFCAVGATTLLIIQGI
jgi:hypothetical protein